MHAHKMGHHYDKNVHAKIRRLRKKEERFESSFDITDTDRKLRMPNNRDAHPSPKHENIEEILAEWQMKYLNKILSKHGYKSKAKNLSWPIKAILAADVYVPEPMMLKGRWHLLVPHKNPDKSWGGMIDIVTSPYGNLYLDKKSMLLGTTITNGEVKIVDSTLISSKVENIWVKRLYGLKSNIKNVEAEDCTFIKSTVSDMMGDQMLKNKLIIEGIMTDYIKK